MLVVLVFLSNPLQLKKGLASKLQPINVSSFCLDCLTYSRLLRIRCTHREKFQESVASCKELERESRLAKNQFNLKKKVFKDLQEKAKVEAPLQDEEGNETELKEKLQVDLAQYETVDHAEAALEEVEYKIRNTFADRNVANFYEKKEKELDVAQDQLHALTKGKHKKMEELRNKSEPWQERLDKLIAKVDSRFSRYMSELGCIGEVSLRKGRANADKDEEPRFDDYGVEIRVSFREGVKPSVLSARVQSGGERSVSTIMYLMAMQVGALRQKIDCVELYLSSIILVFTKFRT